MTTKKTSVTDMQVECAPGVRAVGDEFVAGEVYTLPAEQAKKLIAARKMVGVKEK